MVVSVCPASFSRGWICPRERLENLLCAEIEPGRLLQIYLKAQNSVIWGVSFETSGPSESAWCKFQMVTYLEEGRQMTAANMTAQLVKFASLGATHL